MSGLIIQAVRELMEREGCVSVDITRRDEQ